MFERILVGVDGSDNAREAVEVAAQLAQTHGSLVTLLHVVQVSAIAEEAIKTTATEHLEKNPKSIMAKLSQEILDRAKAHAVEAGLEESRVRVESADGNQASRLIEACKRHEADLIVLGGRGRGRLEGMLLGSVSQKVSALAPCACLIVR
ncbi:MAG: universal stress protein [Alphaproteobacteria bacterium]|nr:universal stress protein [Alphaproteobacteria bacterium]